MRHNQNSVVNLQALLKEGQGLRRSVRNSLSRYPIFLGIFL